MEKRVTILDIAQVAGVSPSTVSRVLNDSKPVAAETRALVLDAVRRLQYQPNVMAQGLARGRSMTVGVLVQDITSPFFSWIVLGIDQGLDRSGYHPMLTTTHWRLESDRSELDSLHMLLDRRVDGVIVVGGQIQDEQLRVAAEQLPVICVARRVTGLEAQCVHIDNWAGGYRATRYLVGLGHRDIAHVRGTPGHPDAAEREEGYRAACANAGLPVNERLLVDGEFTEESGLLAVEELLARGERFTAVFAANDQLAYGVMLGLFNHGFRIPDDVSIVGFDDQVLAAYTLPPLTTVRHPSLEMGQIAAENLLRLLHDRPLMHPHFPTDLVIRNSARRISRDE